MIRLSPTTLLAVIIVLSACGNLEWPPNSGGTGYSINKVGLVNTIENKHRYGINWPQQEEVKKHPNLSSREHIVTAGETLWRIAQAYNIDIYELAILNQIEPPFRIFVGQSLVLSNIPGKPVKLAAFKKMQRAGGETITSFNSPKQRPAKKTVLNFSSLDNQTPPLSVRPGNKPINNREIVFLPNTQKNAWKNKGVMIGKKETNLPSVRRGSLFIWPIKGKLISSFGAKGNGLHNDGINIVAPRGTVVRAAGSGIVAYAGNELRGFGNLLLIKHGNDWVTAYAHNQDVIVRRGEKVKRGQAIAHVGSSGNVSRPQLHFEIRKKNRAIDPIRSISLTKKRRTAVKLGSSKG